MLMTRLQFSFGVVMAFVRYASGEESLEGMPLEDLVDHFVNTFDRNMHEGNAAQMLGASERRLADAKSGAKGGSGAAKDTKITGKEVGSLPSVTYSTICTGNCWSALKKEFTESLKVMDSSECKTSKNKEKAEKVKKGKADAKKQMDKAADDKKEKGGGSGGRLLAAKKTEKQESDCIFDLCAKSQVVDMCNGTAGGNFSIDKYDMNDCKKASAMFICKSVCSASCKDNADMKTLLCGKSGSKSGKFDSEAGGGSLKKMFNGICSQHDGGKYCYDLIKTDLAANSYDVATDKAKEGKMPDPCATDCTSKLGKAVKALGCCFPALMDVQKKYKIVKREQARFTKATAAACAKDTAFAACTAGQLTKTKSKQFKLNTSGSCDNLGGESAEDAFATSMSDQLNLTAGDVEVLTCQTKGKTCAKKGGSGGRRLVDTGSEVDINVQVSGEDADAQMSTLALQMDSGLAGTLTATAEEMAEGETAEATAATGTTAATTAGGGVAMVSSALYRRVSSFASAVVLGGAWLMQ